MDLPTKNWDQNVKFEIPEQYKRIIVQCSGGADSSLMLYLLNQYLLSENRLDVEITVVTKNDDFLIQRPTVMYSQKVLFKMMELFPYNKIKGHYTYFNIEGETSRRNIEYNTLGFTNKETDLILDGRTANPTKLPQRLLDDKGFIEQRAYTRDIDKYSPENNWLDGVIMKYFPFMGVDKRWVADMYDLYNIRESLFPLTWSCVAWAHATESHTKPCGACWWCKERNWAFEHDGTEEEFNTSQIYKQIPSNNDSL